VKEASPIIVEVAATAHKHQMMVRFGHKAMEARKDELDMAGSDSTEIKVDYVALRAAATVVTQQHDTATQDLQTLLSTLESQLQQLAQMVPNIINHARGEDAIVGKQGTTLLDMFTALADSLETTADEADPLTRRVAHMMRQMQ
jgi:hypothetical protein